jgi:hypothetical protein
MEERPLFAMHASEPNEKCEVGGNIQRVLGVQFEQTLHVVEQQLAQTSIRDLDRQIRNQRSSNHKEQ